MSGWPDYAMICPAGHVPAFAGFPFRLFLLPAGMTVTTALAAPGLAGAFLIEPGSIGEVMNGTALPAYLAEGVPIFLHARRVRDLRPLLRRAPQFQARGYSAVVRG